MKLLKLTTTQLKEISPDLADYQVTVQSPVEVLGVPFHPYQTVLFTVVYPVTWGEGYN